MSVVPEHTEEAVEVEDLVLSYADAMDLGDAERAAGLFTPDAVLVGPEGVELVGAAAIAAHLGGEAARSRACAHHVSNLSSTWDRGTGSWRVVGYCMRWREDVDGSQTRSYWRTEDDVVRADAGWRIRRRVVTERGADRTGTVAEQVLEVMATSRAVRRFADRPVPADLVRQVVEAATWAPSPQNRQPWEFVVLTEPESVGVAARAIGPRAAELREYGARSEHPERRKMFLEVASLVEGLGSVPVLILVCGHPLTHASPAGPEAMLLSALYGASQNLLLAARALDLGAVFTTLHVHGEEAIRAGLGIPDDVVIAGTIALGWPDAVPGRVRRRPVQDVLHWQSW
ncbi:nitroreductase family protein [Nocardioides sp. zg-ZUI104]|uniref:nitroreductase family protein n=1 Tax=Nocardioides faecalis TaxID=2803858 RepID=UPI001BCBA0DA|nr:nitroreductase family protein [Nocardioides faecalis]MBS4754559.1 nitroreductase family protein [Nocardioides faecalis]